MSELQQGYQSILSQHGRWTAHNIHLGQGLFTIGEGITHDEYKVRRIAQIVQDHCGEDLSGLRVLDLACLEGMYGIEFAMRGADVLAIEGRRQHIEKAEFAARALKLTNFRVIQGDVRKLNPAEHGVFDVILCLGILYHIDQASLFPMIEAMHACCRNILIIDTHVAMQPRKKVSYSGKDYAGIDYYEYAPNLTEGQKQKALWASLDNPDSFWPTARSLYNALANVGFTSAYECQNPPELQKNRDRITILAKTGKPAQLRSNPQINDQPVENWPEKIITTIHPYQYRHRVLARRIIDAIPAPVKKALKKLAGRA